MENVFQYLQIYLFIKTHQFDFCPNIFEKSKKNTNFYQFPSLRGAWVAGGVDGFQHIYNNMSSSHSLNLSEP